VVEHRERAPVIQEVIKPGVKEEIQPIVHREREQLEIREELLPIYEKSVRPTVFEERNLPAEYRPEIRTGMMPTMQPGPSGSCVVETEHREAVMLNPIVEETVHKKVIEEVVPVIHRETIVPKVVKEVKPIYEKVYETPEVSYVTLPAQYNEEVRVSTQTWQQPLPAPVTQTVTTQTVVEKEFLPAGSYDAKLADQTRLQQQQQQQLQQQQQFNPPQTFGYK